MAKDLDAVDRKIVSPDSAQGRISHEEIARRVRVSRPTAARTRDRPGPSPSTFGQHRLELITTDGQSSAQQGKCKAPTDHGLEASSCFGRRFVGTVQVSDRLGLDMIVQPVGLFVLSLMPAVE
ncbi:AsnC family protein [Streptomyces blattellae]|uniref:AsnC family protein n=1 Tax=Streptomyces blattellae TaxID=2569855 RepID=UPI0012B7A210|nr:AsnC family protein [Streptomyces blattellae]